MENKIIKSNLKKEKLKELLEEVKALSDSVSIARYYEGRMSQDEFNQMQTAFKAYISHEHDTRLNKYFNNVEGYKDDLDSVFHFENEQAARNYFEELFNQEMDIYESCQYCEFENGKKENLNIPNEYLIKREITRLSPVIIGPVFEILTFSMDNFDEVVSSMKKLFSTYKIYGSEFEDLCCYRNDEVIFKICSHEAYAIFIR